MLENIITKELVDQAIVKASKHKLNRSEVQKALKTKRDYLIDFMKVFWMVLILNILGIQTE